INPKSLLKEPIVKKKSIRTKEAQKCRTTTNDTSSEKCTKMDNTNEEP
ncbi:35062_t:CDS:1, partial [Gigaspora margarita]